MVRYSSRSLLSGLFMLCDCLCRVWVFTKKRGVRGWLIMTCFQTGPRNWTLSRCAVPVDEAAAAAIYFNNACQLYNPVERLHLAKRLVGKYISREQHFSRIFL